MPLPLIAAPLLAPVLATAGKYLVGYTIVRVVTALGISLLSFGAVDAIGGNIASYIQSNIGGFGGAYSQYASALGLYQAMNIVSSAYIGAIAVRQVMGAFSRITFGSTSHT